MRPDIAALIAEGEHEMTMKHRLARLEKVREDQGPTLEELIAAAGEGRSLGTPSGSAPVGGRGRRSGPLTLEELIAASYETPTPAGPVIAAEERTAGPTPAMPGPRPPAVPTKPTNPAPRALTVAERIAEDFLWVVERTRRPNEHHRVKYNPY